MRLIKDWRQSWRYYSQVMNLATIGLSLTAIADFIMGLLPIWSPLIEPQAFAILTACTGTLGYIGRVIQQGAEDE